MGRTTKPLTDATIKSASSRPRDYWLRDGHGLGLIVKTTGKKVWSYEYTHPAKRKRTSVKIGSYPCMALKDARDLRIELETIIQRGKCPKEYLNSPTSQSRMTLEAVLDDWLTRRVANEKCSDKQAAAIRRRFELHIFPHTGGALAAQLTAKNFERILKPLDIQGKSETVNRIRQYIDKLYAHAKTQNWVDQHPTLGYEFDFKEAKPKMQPAISSEELPEFLSDLSSSHRDCIVKAAVEFQLHTVSRPGETVLIEWEDIDFDNKLLVIPASKTKGKKRNKAVPLSEQVLTILEKLKPITGHTPYVFASSRSPKGPLGHICRDSLNGLIKSVGYKDRLVAHGLRSVASSTLNQAGIDSDIIEKMLDHTEKNETRKVYNRATYLPNLQKVLQIWSDYIQSCMQPDSKLLGACPERQKQVIETRTRLDENQSSVYSRHAGNL